MNTMEYDLDTSGGLMEEIQRLIAPPVSEDSSKRQKRGTKEFRKHGKAINHDYCDSCTEGGDLVCCDRCPASFHLQCHDPPLEEDDIPPGEWACHRCKSAPPKPEKEKDKDDDTSSTKSGSSNASKGSGNKYLPLPIPIPVLGENPLHTLAEAAKVLNPVQFDLPKDIACTTPLPGSYKRKWWGRDRNLPQKKPPHELDNGLVPLPAKLCFICNRSCRFAALLPCDYCPCLFHLDCLDPPLTSVPTGRWMCPNHPENIVDEKLLKTVCVTERVRLWDRYTKRVNQHSVKVDFLKKIHRKNPMFRIKYKHPRRKAATIPPAIKHFYQHPPDLLPAPSLESFGELGEECQESHMSEASLEDQEQWLKSVVQLQTSIAQFLAKKQLEQSSSLENKSSESARMEKPTASVQPVQNRDLADQSVLQFEGSGSQSDLKSKSAEAASVQNGPLVSGSDSVNVNNGHMDVKNKGSVSLLNPVNGDMDITDRSATSNSVLHDLSPQSSVVKVSWPSDSKQSNVPMSCVSNSQGSTSKNIVISAVNKSNNVITRVMPGVSSKASGPTSILSPRAGSVTGKSSGSNTIKSNISSTGTTTKVITVNPPQAASKTPQNKQAIPVVSGSQGSQAIATLNNTLQQCLEGTADLELSKLDDKLIQILAWQRLQQLMPSKSLEGQKKVSTTINGLLTSPGLQEVQARAVLCPLTGKGDAIPMPYRTLSIGTGADMDVSLGQYGQCNFISSKHAFIFYDETSKHYELLNYSEHGTTVDNVLYSCDFSDKPATTPQPSAVVAAVRHLNSVNKPKMKADERLTMTTRPADMRRACNCKGSSSSLIGGSGAGWEGTAILHHGSYIKVGCIQFVFSIVDHATTQPLHGIKREPMSLLKSHLKGVP